MKNLLLITSLVLISTLYIAQVDTVSIVQNYNKFHPKKNWESIAIAAQREIYTHASSQVDSSALREFDIGIAKLEVIKCEKVHIFKSWHVLYSKQLKENRISIADYNDLISGVNDIMRIELVQDKTK
jgi:hypothetical protein